jgi:beta-lactamase superfamily II metal-dependent hydrolase
MPTDRNPGDIVYSGYPTSHVLNIGRNPAGKIVLQKVKHLLWGDWTSVTDYDFVASGDGAKLNPPLRPEEEVIVRQLTEALVPVRVRGASGYMSEADIQDQRLLEAVFVDVGQGDSALLVTPDDKKFVIDAGIADNMYLYLRWRFRGFEEAHTDFDGIIITHPDADHYKGFERLLKDRAVGAAYVWHNGLMERFMIAADGKQSDREAERLGSTREEDGQGYLVDLMESDADLDRFLIEKRNWVNDRTGNPKLYPELLAWAQAARDENGQRRFPNVSMLSTLHGEVAGGRSYVPGFGPTGPSGCVIEVLGPVVEADDSGDSRLRVYADEPREKTTSMDLGKTKNGHSVLLKLSYRGFSLLFGGDLNSSAESFLLRHYTGLDVLGRDAAPDDEIVTAARKTFGVDVVKACHHGSADFTDQFMAATGAVATIVSSGDEEGHAHPRSDTLGAIGYFGRGTRPLVFSTELARSTREFTRREDTPWFKAAKLEGKAGEEEDLTEKERLLKEARALWEQERITNVTVYGAINLRTDGNRVVLAYMLERPSDSRRWDVYTLEPDDEDRLTYIPVKLAEQREARRRAMTNGEV